MFSGIVETHTEVLALKSTPPSAKLKLKRPTTFQDIKLGDSIATNGVCLTVEAFDDETMDFTLGPETLKITDWENVLSEASIVNLERSLRASDRMHGHMVSGHVDTMGSVKSFKELGDSWELWIDFPESFKPYIWKKGSVALNGVSLTVNEMDGLSFQVTLIPETLRITNLKVLKAGDSVCLEADMMARAIHHYLSERGIENA